MAATIASLERGAKQADWTLIPVGLGLLAMYVPTYLDVARRFWGKDEESHGPIILVVVLWLLWRERRSLMQIASPTEQLLGFSIFALGLVLYIVGRSQEFFQFDVGSQIPVLIGLSLALGGRAAFKRFWFPACFLLFLIPIPPSLLDQVLVPLKVTVSAVVTNGLYALGYPISRSGVMLIVGQYQLLIADACSGLHSMIALTGIGLLYVYLIGVGGKVAKTLLIAAAIPIAFIANIVRVVALVLITYYFGSSAGIGFHDWAGYFEIIFAFAAFFVLEFVMTSTARLLLAKVGR